MKPKASRTTTVTAATRGSFHRSSAAQAGASRKARREASTRGTTSSRPKYSAATTTAPA